MPTLNRGPADRGSAEIIAFPPRGRYAAGEGVADTQAQARVNKAVSGSSWYHEEAIREERNIKN
jgi:hypothetical protein